MLKIYRHFTSSLAMMQNPALCPVLVQWSTAEYWKKRKSLTWLPPITKCLTWLPPISWSGIFWLDYAIEVNKNRTKILVRPVINHESLRKPRINRHIWKKSCTNLTISDFQNLEQAALAMSLHKVPQRADPKFKIVWRFLWPVAAFVQHNNRKKSTKWKINGRFRYNIS